ncbi:MAG: DedA family protein [Campylobacter sp.]|nr:DedA family protein [Campylobacter sp.]
MLENFSYTALFIVSFLSSTLVPLSSEAFVFAFIKLDFNPYIVLIVATFANTLGSLSTYILAFLGKNYILEKYFSKNLKKLEKLSFNFYKFGAFFAFFTFLPFVGDIFALGLGFAKYPWLKCAFFIFLGKFLRYILLIFLANFVSIN